MEYKCGWPEFLLHKQTRIWNIKTRIWNTFWANFPKKCIHFFKNRAFFSIFWWFLATILLSIMFINEKCKKFQLISRIFKMLRNLPVPITNFYLANAAKLSEVLILLHKMETRIWNKTRIWNTFAGDQVIFHIRV